MLSGYSIDSEVSVFMVGVAILADLFIVGYIIYMVVDKTKSKASNISNDNLSNKKNTVINELKTQLVHKQDILNRFEKYHCKKQQTFNLLTLILKCDVNNSQTLIDAFNNSEMNSFVHLKTDILPILTDDETQMFPVTINDFAKYKIKLNKEIEQIKEHISSVASADKTSLNEIIETSCPVLNKELRKKKIKTIISCLICVIIVVSIIITSSYINNAPYRELRTEIDNQTLTTEMVEWENRDFENSYYEYFHSEKGHEFLADVFSELHKNNEIEKAMWLLCVQPDCIDGINLCASDSFIDWVVKYAKENGTKIELPKGDTAYTVNGYEITITSIFNYSIGHHFNISNGTEKRSVENKNLYYEGTVPTIR